MRELPSSRLRAERRLRARIAASPVVWIGLLCEPVVVSDDDSPLQAWGSGMQVSGASLRGDVVLRDAGPWSVAVLALLRHFEVVGFDGAPRVVGSGFDADGREMIRFVPGSSPHPSPWSGEELYRIGDLLRRAHSAAATFRVHNAEWRSWFGRDLPGDDAVIGHCDPGPWNIVRKPDGKLALIDWEYAGPTDAIWELAHAAWLNAQLHDDDIAEMHGLPDVEARARQVGELLDGYRLGRARRQGFVARMIEFAVHSARAEAVTHAVTATSTEAVTAAGYPLLWAITWRTRSAAWMATHRQTLERAIE